MYKLYTFGCSFTEDFENVISSYNNNSVQKNLENRPAQIKYIEDFLNGEVPESWSKILGKLLNFEVKNCAQGGSSNYDIFERVCENSKNYTKNDIVIVGWTHFMRFRWPTPNGWCPMFTNFIDNAVINFDEDTHNKIIYARDNSCVIDEIYNFQKILLRLSESVGFKVYFWAACNKIINGESKEFKNNNIYLLNKILTKNYSIFDEVFKMGGKTIRQETNGKINDNHLGKTGHKVQAELFYEHILST
jgi:hypothetical protein